MQRKNRSQTPLQASMTEEEQLFPLIIDNNQNTADSNNNIDLEADNYRNGKAADLKIPALDNKEVIVATVIRKKCGTSPFDEHWLNVDCCGLICASITYLLHLYGIHVVCNLLIPPWMSYKTEDGVRHLSMLGYLNSFLFISIAMMAIISHFKAMTTDPGAVPPDATPFLDPSEKEQNAGNEKDDKADKPPKLTARPPRICRRCNTFKPLRAHHCSVCNRCITKMDHHCPWVNNCVGIGNHKYFLLFIFYTFLSCMYSLFLLILRVFVCIHTDDNGNFCLDDPAHLLSLSLLTIESLLFGLFTSCMMVDQWDVVTTNLTHIDRLKGETFFMEQHQERMKNGPRVNEVFGIGNTGRNLLKNASSFRSDWLSPFVRVVFPDSIHDEIMGFCRPCCGPMRSNLETEDDDNFVTPKVRNTLEDIV